MLWNISGIVEKETATDIGRSLLNGLPKKRRGSDSESESKVAQSVVKIKHVRGCHALFLSLFHGIVIKMKGNLDIILRACSWKFPEKIFFLS